MKEYLLMGAHNSMLVTQRSDFKILAIQSWKKYIDFKKTKGKNVSSCLKEQTKETHEPPSSEIGEVE